MKKVIAIAAATIGMVCMAQGVQAAGNVEDATPASGSGWACDASTPYWQGNVLVKVDGVTLVAQGAANQAREAAVGAVCGGYSSHGFSLNWSLPPSIPMDGTVRNVHFYYQLQNGSTVEVPGSPKAVCFGTVISPSGSGCSS